MILKVILASSFGALVSISLGKYINDQPFFLAIWAIIGGLVGFISVGPLYFYSKFKEVLLEKLNEHKRKLIDNKLFREACIIQIKRFSVRLGKVICCLFWLFPIMFFIFFRGKVDGFIYDFLFFYSIAFTVCFTLTLLSWIWDFLVSTDSACLIDIYQFDCRSESYKEDLEEKLEDEVIALKKYLFFHREIVKTFKSFSKETSIFISWTKSNSTAIVKTLIYSFMITCYAISSVHRWNAVLGSIFGFIIGWILGRSEIIGMISGGGFGALIYLVTSYVASKIPKEGIVWPEFVHAVELD